MDLYFTLEDFDCEDIRLLACKTLTPKEKPRLCLDIANPRGLRVNKFHGKYTRKYISKTVDHQEVEQVNELTFLECKVCVLNN